MPRSLSPLQRTSFSGLDYTNIIEDITNLVQDNPDYNSSWDDFLSSNAGRMLVELFAYIADQLATRIDWMANENWIGTATQKLSVMRILKLIGYNFNLPVASKVATTVSLASFPGEFYLTEEYVSGENFSPYSLTAKDRDGNTKRYELIEYDSTIGSYEYKNGVKISSALSIKNFYEGTTYIENLEVENDNAQTFTLLNYPVIENSIRVYFVDESGAYPTETELTLVNSFLDAEAQRDIDEDGDYQPIPYILNVNENESVTIEFGSTALLQSSSRRPARGDLIRVFYRYGGGIDGNLTIRAINTTKTITVTPISTGIPVISKLTFTNLSEGVDGVNGETAAKAANYGPLQIRTANKAVTPDDYDIILAAKTGVITAKAYGSNNMPSTVFTDYNTYIQPLDVWCYVVPDVSGWRNFNPSDYRKIEWMSLEHQNYFNEPIVFSRAYFNIAENSQFNSSEIYGRSVDGIQIAWGDTTVFSDGDTKFYNYVLIPIGDTIGDSILGNSYFKMNISETADSTRQFNSINNYVFGDTDISSGDSLFRIKKNINAYYKSLVNVEDGIDMTVKKNIKINIDDKGDTTIDLSAYAYNKAKVMPNEIAVAINKQMFYNANYGAGAGDTYGDSTGNTGIASIVEPSSSYSYIKLTSPLSGDSSFVVFKRSGIGDSDVTEDVFGSSVSGDTYFCYGYRRLTYVYDSTSLYYKNLIFELGTQNLDSEGDTFFVHALLSTGDSTSIGVYYNQSFSASDPEYRSIASRVYNSIPLSSGDSGDSINEPDMYTSNFFFKFTNAETEYMSIYKITDSWGLTYATKPTIWGDSVSLSGDTIVGLGSNYSLHVEIDNKGDTIIDVTEDSGASGNYIASDIVDSINDALRNFYDGEGYPYQTFNYAYYDSRHRAIRFQSPSRDNNASIRFIPTSNDAKEKLFNVSITGDSDWFYATGDYYLIYDSALDRMKIVRLISNNQTSFPDGTVYAHFIWDRSGDSSIDEVSYQAYMLDKKIIGLNNIFKQAKFDTFDVSGTVYYDNLYAVGVIKNAVETALYKEYSFVDSDETVKRDFGISVNRSKLLTLVQQIEGIEYIEINYFGRDVSDSSTNEQNTISCGFDEILVLHEQASGKGVNFTYVAIEVN
jgi:hypothetical protein